jgi:prepilin-type processing-associated H-X9-DG protein
MYMYFPGPTELEFGGLGTRIRVPNQLNQLALKNWVILQDRVDYSNFWGTWRFNHGAGGVHLENPTTNPSNTYRRGAPGGGNLLYVDGHVTWYTIKNLSDADSDADAQMTVFPEQ